MFLTTMIIFAEAMVIKRNGKPDYFDVLNTFANVLNELNVIHLK